MRIMRFFRRIHFNLWYYHQPPWDTDVSPPELIEFINTNPSGRVLDLGCGTGTNAITLAKNGWDAVGVDFAAKAIKIAQKKANDAGVRAKFVLDDVATLKKVTGKFDLILDIGCLHSLSLKDKKRYIINLERLLSDNSYFLAYAFLKQYDENSPGLGEEDIEVLSNHLQLINRKDSTENNWRPSVWLLYQR